ncbi:MAG: Biotin transporter BioY [Alphaproteobacteria bacterium MarineAlpha5_Bin2]|jgi:biotin transport system substrate-specific component|nr:biotin transporter BioY [Alphaproteobacteria bacterium]PPR53396.1 MAG: Biotin transporter BioY [Alphaproteobacteria bacterium MarineAlpha5_Bin2]
MKNNTALINLLFPTQGASTYIKNILLILFGTILLAISSKIQVPFWPVPMTMQTFIVFLIGMTYGWRLSFFTLLAYLVEGALGLPVFAKGGGLMYLAGPTAGYLYGMLGAATLMGFLSEKGYSQSYFKCFITLILGSIVIFAFGVGYLGSIIGYDKALSAGLMPFVPSEFFKIALALVLIPSFTKFLNK